LVHHHLPERRLSERRTNSGRRWQPHAGATRFPRHGIEVTAMPAPGRLKDKVAVVFGAGPNIGGTIAHFLARAGAQVAP
jgi:hypothetical protein